MKRLTLIFLTCCAALAIGCGGSGGEDPAPTKTKSAADAVRERNEAAINNASEAPDARAAAGEQAIVQTLKRKLGMNRDKEFGFKGNPDANDCYVKTGAEAVDFADMDENILYSPTNPDDLVFVQTFQGVSLVKCLRVVKGALSW